jgi:arylsulfatase A-like enzyme
VGQRKCAGRRLAPQAARETIEGCSRKFSGLANKHVTLMAMLKHLGDRVGAVIAMLKQEDLFKNTILFFLIDNGGSRAMNGEF